MRKLMTLAVVVGMLSVMTVEVALAAPVDKEPTCQPGAGDNSVHATSWELLDVDRLAKLYTRGEGDEQRALESAERTFDFCDHNGDGLLCTMTQYLPNDANGSAKWYLSEDNHYAPAS